MLIQLEQHSRLMPAYHVASGDLSRGSELSSLRNEDSEVV